MKNNTLEIENSINELLQIVEIDNFSFSKDEIENISRIFIEKNIITEKSMYYYIGEAYINLIGGKWKLNTTKKDPAYGRMCIVDWAKGATRIDPMFILNELEKTQDYNTIYNAIESTKKNIIEINNILKDIGLDL